MRRPLVAYPPRSFKPLRAEKFMQGLGAVSVYLAKRDEAKPSRFNGETMDAIFRLSNLLVLPFWALIILAPRWRWTKRIMQSPLISAAPAALYAALVLPRLAEVWLAVTRPTLTGIMVLLGSSGGATIAWVHFLAFDLLVARWIFLDAQERHITAWLTSPVLFLTLMLGPSGFLLYLFTRFIVGLTRRQTPLTEKSDRGEKRRGSLTGSATLTQHSKTSSPRFWRQALATSSPLIFLGSMMMLTFLVAIAGVFIDHRVITGAPLWLKPAKFAISVSIYCFTFVWLLGFVENHPRLVRLAGNVTVASFIVEMVVIIGQAARGTTSHFNLSTPLNTFLWMMMGTFIVFVWVMNLLVAILLLRQRMSDRPFAWSLRLGLVISLVGMAAAFFMIRPTPDQVASIAAGHRPQIMGAHSVGVKDGGPGLPIVGWSTVGGDLRVAHFVGLHGLQVLPFLGWLLSRRKRAIHFNEGHRLSLVWTIGLAYLGMVFLLMWQALRGQSVVHPDGKTASSAAVLISLAVVSIVATVAHARQARGIDPRKRGDLAIEGLPSPIRNKS